MEETIDLREYFQIIKKRFWIIALLAVIAMVASGLISFFVLSPVYEAKTTLIVNTEQVNETNTITGDKLNVTQKLTLTYGEIIWLFYFQRKLHTAKFAKAKTKA